MKVIIGPVWDGFGRTSPEGCVGCGWPLDQYSLGDDDDDEEFDAATFVDIMIGEGRRLLCFECAKTSGIENPQLGQQLELRMVVADS